MTPAPSEGAVFSLAEIRERHRLSGDLYVEFLRVPAMSTGFYALPVGGVDPQTPHREDEVYHVIRGRAKIRIGERDHPVETGATVYVAKGVEHRFHSVTEPLELLVVFAPAESPVPAPAPGGSSEKPPGSPRPGKVS